MEKTNVMRLLDAAKIEYIPHEYSKDVTDGEKIAKMLGEDLDSVFKTLVTRGHDKNYYVFCVPVSEQLDLKKAAKAVGVKSIEMIPQKELLPLTGYIHGGCSPIGMKKKFKTIINDTAILFDHIYVSAGKVGYQIELNSYHLKDYIEAQFIDIIE
ncbi:Cys-tRNA(Pro) deacylase [Acholeplasma hippikon]|uniref:Cys-tRNA(Pro)/Cys-tRNA(Cys) deacylase n=1 Tax=Acholeplasma hippikon TaxID=264636 RepID=A0A449BLA0_9MOLU|nr:Cys-tRNA(Pro) deacylase [Acholeplasma hippikon]VEU83137.1 Cys-tRNA(Pro)/Cys-tRNA(Cys) deacylase ybaK [Acholeplasma hippikon]